MWLVQIKKTMWIDAEKIDCIWTDGGKLKLTVVSDGEHSFTVDSELESSFINHVGAINQNVCCQFHDQVEAAKNDG